MQPDALLDTNILLRQVLQDIPDRSARATALIAAIEQGQRAVRLADTVVFEAVFTLEKTYGVPRPAIHADPGPAGRRPARHAHLSAGVRPLAA